MQILFSCKTIAGNNNNKIGQHLLHHIYLNSRGNAKQIPLDTTIRVNERQCIKQHHNCTIVYIILCTISKPCLPDSEEFITGS